MIPLYDKIQLPRSDPKPLETEIGIRQDGHFCTFVKIDLADMFQETFQLDQHDWNRKLIIVKRELQLWMAEPLINIVCDYLLSTSDDAKRDLLEYVMFTDM
jgi:hypothetical protein